ncbi:MAG: glutathione S-transferase family protein [Proteobacteria bacterium]|nr:glutathione S-transferase family protein [Pseudomonadota bacterium]
MSYKLYYFSARGRGEQIRLLCRALQVPLDDVRVKPDKFLEFKAQGPSMLFFGSLPMLEDGDFRLPQGPVIMSYIARQHGAVPDDPRLSAKIEAINWGAEDLRSRYFTLFGQDSAAKQVEFTSGDWKQRWLTSFDGLLEMNGDTGYFVGDRLTHADIAVWDALDAVLSYVPSASLDGFSRLQAFYDSVRTIPSIEAYLNSDQRPQ